ncbi:hypothetical protein [Acidipila rosea]|uniref:F-type H+-transporting ATPase subunit b n=1 Tax=Acidipila rosea TaxID=768535 RepID=A0A4R1L913_9BACT|nr:hypothetical protein [Acidipila rosea]TCK73700.1 F-type H+-transporting ATPase subunit b [Acidipila rosea]
MDEILRQLGQLVLGSVPTMVIFLVLVLAYRSLVAGPLARTLAERREHTQGAVEKAHAAIAAADAKSQEYEAKLRAARTAIFKQREHRLQQWSADRDSAVASARLASQERVKQAQAEIAAQAVDARKQIEGSTGELAGQILKAILPSGMAPAESTR